MKTFPSLYIDPNGTLKAGEFPEEPKRPSGWKTKGGLTVEMGGDFGYEKSMRKYHEALAAAKDSAVEVENKEQAQEVIISEYLKRGVGPPFMYRGSLVTGLNEGVYRLPDGWGIEVELRWRQNISYMPHEVKVAVLVPHKSPHGFCEKPGSDCTMNYCDENGCNDRKRSLVPPKSEQQPLNHLPDSGKMVESQEEYILCAAIHFDDGNEYVHQPVNITTGFVVAGRRHHNCFASYSAMRSVRGTTDADIDRYPRKSIQGFLTSKDRFIDRAEAAALALKTSQIKEPVKILFSEHLY